MSASAFLLRRCGASLLLIRSAIVFAVISLPHENEGGTVSQYLEKGGIFGQKIFSSSSTVTEVFSGIRTKGRKNWAHRKTQPKLKMPGGQRMPLQARTDVPVPRPWIGSHDNAKRDKPTELSDGPSCQASGGLTHKRKKNITWSPIHIGMFRSCFHVRN